MVRREDERTDACKDNVPGVMIESNPGVMAVWNTLAYKLIPAHAKDSRDACIVDIGEPESVEWFTRGRTATREEVSSVMQERLPILSDMAREEGPRAMLALAKMVDAAMKYLPA